MEHDVDLMEIFGIIVGLWYTIPMEYAIILNRSHINWELLGSYETL